jgi:hypothetical protein
LECDRGGATFAPNFAVETTLIENWLKLEARVSAYYTRNATEWIRPTVQET